MSGDPRPWVPGDSPGTRKHAPATLRNREPIAVAMAGLLPAAGLVLEVASGSGEHCAFLAERFPGLAWQPSERDAEARASIAAWCEDRANVRPPLALDAAATDWPIDRADVIFCANMVHISPWEATLGLLAGAGRILPAGAPLVLYGPYRRSDVPTAESNEAFDVSLTSRNPDWGLRDLAEVTEAAQERGLAFDRLIEMPANNVMPVYRRR